jgi:hypothetical protein
MIEAILKHDISLEENIQGLLGGQIARSELAEKIAKDFLQSIEPEDSGSITVELTHQGTPINRLTYDSVKSKDSICLALVRSEFFMTPAILTPEGKIVEQGDLTINVVSNPNPPQPLDNAN